MNGMLILPQEIRYAPLWALYFSGIPLKGKTPIGVFEKFTAELYIRKWGKFPYMDTPDTFELHFSKN